MKYNCLPDPDTKLKEQTHSMVSGFDSLADPDMEATASNDFISMSVSIYRMRQLASYSVSVKERMYPWSKNKGDSSELFTGSLDRFALNHWNSFWTVTYQLTSQSYRRPFWVDCLHCSLDLSALLHGSDTGRSSVSFKQVTAFNSSPAPPVHHDTCYPSPQPFQRWS